MKSLVFLNSFVLLALGVPAYATTYYGVTIAPTFDPSIASVSGAEGAIDAAITTIEGSIETPNSGGITVTIYFTNMTSGLGESETGEYAPSYFQYYSAFKTVATQPNQVTALASLGTAPTSASSGNPVNGNTSVIITSAEGRNLGLGTPGVILPNSNIADAGTGGTYDGEIGLNTSITSPPGSLSDSYSLESTAMHEIDEVLGIGGTGSNLASGTTGPVGDLDLYRYSAPGTRSYTTTQTTSPLSYFSINGGTTVLTYFNQTAGADYADWLSNPIPAGFGAQVQDAFGQVDSNPTLGVNELTAFNAIGYGLSSTPEPATLGMIGAGLCLIGFVARRRGRRD